jgi:hypothetical protein
MSGFKRVVDFYVDGFKSLPPWARAMGIILLVLFVVFRFLSFQNFLKPQFETDEDRVNQVIEQITNP